MTSSLYCELSEEQLAEIVSYSLRTKLLSASLLTGGMFNTTYLVKTEKYGLLVLRLGPINRHLLMPFEHYLMEAEEYVYALCVKQGIPVPEVLLTDTTKTLIDRDFMITRYIPSRPMCDITLGNERHDEIVRDIGIATARMHEITASHFGRIVDVKNGGGFELWSEALFHELWEWEQVGVPTALFSESEHDEIRMLFEKAVPYLDQITTPHLVHNDLWCGNILIRTDTEKNGFVAIIDADRALWGDPDLEFSAIQWTHSEDSFWIGYGRRISYDHADCIRRGIYNLITRLWNAYVYLCEYNQYDNAISERGEAVRQMIDLKKIIGEEYEDIDHIE